MPNNEIIITIKQFVMKKIFMIPTFNNATASSNDTEKEDTSAMFYKTGFYIYIYIVILLMFISFGNNSL